MILIQTFAIDIVGAERFNTLIGLVFLAIVFVAGWSSGLMGQSKTPDGAGVVAFPPRRGAVLRAQTQSTQGRMNDVALTFAFGCRVGGGSAIRHWRSRRSRKIPLRSAFSPPSRAFTVLGEDSRRGAVMAVDDFGGKVGGKKIEIIKGSSGRFAG